MDATHEVICIYVLVGFWGDWPNNSQCLCNFNIIKSETRYKPLNGHSQHRLLSNKTSEVFSTLRCSYKQFFWIRKFREIWKYNNRSAQDNLKWKQHEFTPKYRNNIGIPIFKNWMFIEHANVWNKHTFNHSIKCGKVGKMGGVKASQQL